MKPGDFTAILTRKGYAMVSPQRYPVQVADLPQASAAVRQPIRQRVKGDGMNKWERQFLTHLKFTLPTSSIHREVSLPLANGLRYKVDFLVGREIQGATGGADVVGYEVKGFRRAAGIAKLKMAASVYPWIKFSLVTREKGGGWKFTEVFP